MGFSDKLIEMRKTKGWSQEELGSRLEVSRQTISKWELGETTPEMNKLRLLGALFDISLDELVMGKSEVISDERASSKEVVYVALKQHYEYKSRRTIYGLPLVHINIGRGFYRAKGIIAIGNIATGALAIGILSGGLIAFGVLALGLLVFGALGLGLLATGGLAVGLVAIGGVAIGYLAVGGLAVGVYAIGGCALARDIALGGYASGHIAIGDAVKGTYEYMVNDSIKEIDAPTFHRIVETTLPKANKTIVDIFAAIIE